MPKVPLYDSLQVGETLLPGARVDAPPVQNFAGQQAEALGRNALQLGTVASAIENDIQRQANALRVDDALNKAKEEALRLTFDKDVGYTNQRGLQALERESGKPLADEYAETLKKRISDLSGGLGNDAQKMMFSMRANDIVTNFYGNATKHESEQFREYALSVREGTISTRMQEIGLNYNNPQVIDGAVTSIQAAVADQARLLGKSATWAEAQSRKMTSNAHKVALGAALEKNDIEFADAYLQKYSKQMDADDLLRVRGLITKEMDARVGMRAAVDVVKKAAPRIETGDAERAFNIALGTESGYRQFDRNGNPLTSPKGATGIAQVMPATGPEAAKLAGLPWDENRFRTDADYNKALGMAYFQKQLQDNGGDVRKAWAAYNAGPGRLAEAVKKADMSAKLNANDPTVQVKTWLDFMPKETRDYVAKNSKAFESGQGSEQRITFEEIDSQLRADPRLANNPDRYKIARVEAQRMFKEQEVARKTRDDQAVETAMRAIVENGGRYADLPVAIRSRIPPKEIDNLMGFAQKIAKGDDNTSLWLYNDMTANPSKYTGMSDAQFYALRRELSDADFKHFSNERAKYLGKGQPGSAGDLNSSAIKETLDARLRILKIDPTPKDDGGADASRIGAIRKFVNDYFLTTQRESGKKLSDQEVAAHIDTLFAKNATFRGFFSDSSGPMLTMKPGDIPSAEKDAIKSAFKRSGVDSPTDAQILDIYWKRQLARK